MDELLREILDDKQISDFKIDRTFNKITLIFDDLSVLEVDMYMLDYDRPGLSVTYIQSDGKNKLEVVIG